MSNVYIVTNPHKLDRIRQELVPSYDFTDAERYGEVSFLLSPNANPLGPGVQEIARQLHEKLAGFTDQDHLLLVGNPVLIGMATAIAANYSGGVVNVLQWSGRDMSYKSITVDLSE